MAVSSWVLPISSTQRLVWPQTLTKNSDLQLISIPQIVGTFLIKGVFHYVTLVGSKIYVQILNPESRYLEMRSAGTGPQVKFSEWTIPLRKKFAWHKSTLKAPPYMQRHGALSKRQETWLVAKVILGVRQEAWVSRCCLQGQKGKCQFHNTAVYAVTQNLFQPLWGINTTCVGLYLWSD